MASGQPAALRVEKSHDLHIDKYSKHIILQDDVKRDNLPTS